MDGFIGVNSAVDFAKSFHFVTHYVVIDLLLNWIFGLELIHLFEALIFIGEMKSFNPFMEAQTNITELSVNTTLELNILTVKFPNLDMKYSLTCSVRPFSSPSKLTMVFFYF
jgi:hypothetical protein